ncbi:MAG: cysteine methyltransferase [Candidatus Melainabacteria bacterium HGW-Melainabacteria-1]|nr:MAG: cysteine methyltransferase [Candidatus Melainabacteria bacterium HGW-Melainabacteria-1]
MSKPSEFRQQVLNLVRQIPRGQVASYGQIARLAGHPRAARQVGRMLYGLSAAEADVPWQRVINASGGLSTWRIGSGELQQAMLEAEGIVFVDGHCDLSCYQWSGPESLHDGAQ